ncbi:MAG: aminopeptidase [Bacteroidales bacterium]|nr:aminopeptidase [Bacteroidales bacterium]
MKTKYIRLTALLLAMILIAPAGVQAQRKKRSKKKGDEFKFTIQVELPRTATKSQGSSGTCWAFSGTSFIESEAERVGKDSVDLSVMYTVRNAYLEKADRYARWHGKIEFGPGGAFHDVINSIKKYGIVPMEIYPGNEIGEKTIKHGEMDGVLRGYMDGVIKNSNRKLSTAWKPGLANLVDAYLGKVPEKFTYKGQSYTPKSFAASLGLNFDDYIEITSFTHHPFYKPFVLEVPDNWDRDLTYNVPLDEMIEIINHELENGYTVAWGADLDPGFNYKDGVAIVPPEKWDHKTFKPGIEVQVSQERRQKEFNNYQTTDDHGMHLVGIATDQNGTRYYLEKNSWGEKNKYKGYSYISEQYVRLKTTDIMVNKNGLPPALRAKLGL